MDRESKIGPRAWFVLVLGAMALGLTVYMLSFLATSQTNFEIRPQDFMEQANEIKPGDTIASAEAKIILYSAKQHDPSQTIYFNFLQDTGTKEERMSSAQQIIIAHDAKGVVTSVTMEN